jgi:Ca-activated chloride channel family protein
MKWITLLVLTFLFSNDPVEIARINSMKKEAERSFLENNYPAAINYYHTLIDSLGAEDDELFLNLAHAYYENGDSTQARTYYSQASTADKSNIKSIAYQQLGAIAKEGQQLEESLNYLKASIKADPHNQDARYDYELVKKLLDQQKQNQKNQENQNQDQQNEDQNEENQEQNQENQDQNQEGEQDQQQEDQQQQNPDDKQEQQEGDQEEQEQQEQEGQEQQEEQQDPQDMSTKEKLEQMNISEEKARMILEAMRNSEIQYLQQQKRKPTKRPETGKPDW